MQLQACGQAPLHGMPSQACSNRCLPSCLCLHPDTPPASPPCPAAEQEQTKAWLHILLDIAVMVCVMLSDPSLPHSPAPLPTLIVTSCLTVLDMVRLPALPAPAPACLPISACLPASLWALTCACLWDGISLAGVATLSGYVLNGAC